MRPLIGAMALASGAAALLYQTLWMRGFSLAFGSSTRAAGLCLAVFMAGLACGGAWMRRWRRAADLRDYALLEAGIAACAAASFFLLQALPSFAAQAGLLAKALLAAACVFPAAFLAGATLPALLQSSLGAGLTPTQGFSWLYRLNTLGAAAGTLAASFLLIPRFGLAWSYAAAIAANLGVAAAAWSLAGPAKAPQPVPDGESAPAQPWHRLPLAAFCLGASAFILEVAWMRSFALAVGSSVYAFELMLAALLLGTALGTWIYEARYKAVAEPGRLLPLAMGALFLIVLAEAALAGALPGLYFKLVLSNPPGFGRFQLLSFLMVFFAMLPVTLLQGFLFPLLLRLEPEGLARRPQAAAGRLYAWNTGGAILGALGCAFLLVPRLGVQAAYSAAAALPLLGAAALLGVSLRARAALALGALALGALLAASYRPWNPLLVTGGAYLYAMTDKPAERDYAAWAHKGQSLLYYREGAEATISVKDNGASRSLQINGKTDASDGGDLGAFKLVAHKALALHPGAKSAFLIGWGSGCTAGAAGLAGLDTVDVAEIEPAVFAAAPFFRRVNRGAFEDPRFRFLFEDGRNVLLAGRRRYDMISSNPSNPWLKGVGNLFTVEFYDMAARSLAPGGVFSQWFHFYHMRQEDLRMVLRSFLKVFPHASLWLVPAADEQPVVVGDLILLGSLDPLALDPGRLGAFFAKPGMAEELAAIGIRSPLSFALDRFMEAPGIAAYAGDGPLNRDLHPILEYSAPRALYQDRQSTNLENLKTFAGLEAASSLPQRLAAFPDFEGARGEAEQLRRAAELCAVKNRFVQAQRLVDEAGRRWPGDPRFDYARALLALYHGGHEEAEALLRRYLGRYPGERQATVRLGKLRLGRQRFAEALELYQAMAGRWPKDAEAYLGQGLALVRLGRVREAEASLARALELKPGDPMASGMLEQVRLSLAGQRL